MILTVMLRRFGCMMLSTLFGSVTASAAVPTDYFSLHSPYARLNCTARSATLANACLDQALEQAENRLNQRFEQLFLALQAHDTKTRNTANPRSTALYDAQHAWLKMRAKACAFEGYSTTLDTQYTNSLKICLLSYTRERADYVQWYMAHLTF